MASATEQAQTLANPASIRRRFRLLDAMILVAATALGFGAIGWFAKAAELSLQDVSDAVSEVFPKQGRPISAQLVVGVCAMGGAIVTPLFAAWALALLSIRLISPRPRLRRLASQPGMMAVCSSIMVLAVLGLFFICVILVSGGLSRAEEAVEYTFYSLPVLFGLTVAASWMSLLVGRRWRAERSWVDRAGRALGCVWIVAGLLMIYFLAVQVAAQPLIGTTQVRSVPPPQPVSETE
jgi:hypothetical protein